MVLLVTNFCEIFSIRGMWLAVTLMVIIHYIMVIRGLFFGEKAWI